MGGQSMETGTEEEWLSYTALAFDPFPPPIQADWREKSMGNRGGVTTLAQPLSPCPRWCSQTDGPGTSPLYGRSLLPCVSASSHNTSWPVSLRNNERRHVMQPQYNNAPFDAQYLLVLSGLKYQKLLQQQVCLKYHYEVKTAQCFTIVHVHVMDNKKRAVKRKTSTIQNRDAQYSNQLSAYWSIILNI